MRNRVKILIGYHRKAQIFKSDILLPIHLGRALGATPTKDGETTEKDYQFMIDNMIGDDTGDNISALNRYFNEMSMIYWAWKNYDKLGEVEFIGFMHYRRFFRLPGGQNTFKSIINYCNLTEESISKEMAKYDFITLDFLKPNKELSGVANIYELYKRYEALGYGFKPELFDYALKTAKE